MKITLKGEDACDVEQLLVNYSKVMDIMQTKTLDQVDDEELQKAMTNFDTGAEIYCKSVGEVFGPKSGGHGYPIALNMFKNTRIMTYVRFFLALKILEQCTGDYRNKNKYKKFNDK